MRIFSGTARGRYVTAPKGVQLRPTTDKARLALFNALGALVPGSTFLDAFCGSGSVGLEALSRGASKAVFVDSKRPCVESVKATAGLFGFAPESFEAWCADYQRAFNTLAGRGLRFDLAFLDPPYDAGLGAPALVLLVQLGLMAPGPQSRVILEHSSDHESPQCPGLALYKRYEHGAAAMSAYALEGAQLAL